MKFKTTLSLAVLALMNTDAASGKQRVMAPHVPEVQSTHTRKVRSPIVQGYSNTCYRECIFEDDNNRWCLTTTSPMLKAGWQWEQTSDSSTYWTIQLQPYLEP